MKMTPVRSVMLGLLAGGILGAGLGLLRGDAVRGMQLGMLAGLFLGWITTSPPLQL